MTVVVVAVETVVVLMVVVFVVNVCVWVVLVLVAEVVATVVPVDEVPKIRGHAAFKTPIVKVQSYVAAQE